MDNRNNGHSDAFEDILEQAQIDGGKLLDQDSFETAYSTPNTMDTTRLLISPTTDIIALLMKSNIISGRLGMALVGYYQKSLDHEYEEGQEFVKMMVAAFMGIKGNRSNLVSDTIIGERKHSQTVNSSGFINKIKGFMNPND